MTGKKRTPGDDGTGGISGNWASHVPSDASGAVSRHVPSDASGAASRRGVSSGGPDIDPELVDDLGPELGFRGDAVAAELEAARAEAAEWRDKAARTQAEFENVRRRLETQHVAAVSRAGQRIIESLLPVLDNLERAIDHTMAGGDLGELVKGVEMVHGQMLEVLAKEGVDVIDPFGQIFDPNIHQAVGQREDSELPEHTIVEVYQKGYTLAGKVVRAPMVIVSTGGPA